MKLSALLHYQIDPDKPRTLRQNALRWLAGFFGLMLICTLLSRAADSLTVATVETIQPQRTPLSHSVTTDGRLSATGETAVTALSGVLVQSVAVRQGETVKAGDPLFTLDTTDLKSQLYRNQLELNKLQIQLSNAQLGLDNRSEEQGLRLARAQEDFDFAVNRNRNKLRQAAEDRRIARQELKDYINDNDIDESAEDDEQDSTYIALKNAYRSAQRTYEDLENNETEEMAKAERAIEDAMLETPDITADTLAIDCRLRQLALDEIQTVLTAEGIVTAPIDGIITQISLSVGKLTTAEAGILLTGGENGLRYTAEISKEDSRHVSVGDIVRLTFSGTNTTLDVPVESIAAIPEKSGWFALSAAIPSGTGSLGMAVSGKVTQKTQTYSTCVPLSAVRSEGNQRYVLAVVETETALGIQQTAYRIDVSVTDQNSTLAAISGGISSEDQIIINSSKSIIAGDRIRLAVQ